MWSGNLRVGSGFLCALDGCTLYESIPHRNQLWSCGFHMAAPASPATEPQRWGWQTVVMMFWHWCLPAGPSCIGSSGPHTSVSQSVISDIYTSFVVPVHASRDHGCVVIPRSLRWIPQSLVSSHLRSRLPPLWTAYSVLPQAHTSCSWVSLQHV